MLERAKRYQNEYKSDLNEIKKGKINRKSKKFNYTIWKRFINQELVLLLFLIIILEWYLRLILKQLMVKVSKY